MDTNNKYKEITELDGDEYIRNVFYAKSSPAEIWKEVADKDRRFVSELCRAMKELVYSKVPGLIVNTIASLLYKTAYQKHGLFIDESDFWADLSGTVTRPLMAFIQHQYTLVHAACSTLCMWDGHKKEMVCVRSLDWPGADDLARCTRILKFFDNESPEPAFQAAGVVGMVGILTGMKEGFSLCINFAPWHFGATLKTDPLFALRKLLEDGNIQTYPEVKKSIEQWEVGAPCFITICGTQKGEACVVECGKHKNYTREIGENRFMVQTNHFDIKESPFKRHNKKLYGESPPEKDGDWYTSDLLKNSGERRRRIESWLQTIPPDTDSLDEEILKAYLVPPVLNHETAQWVVMRPKSNSLRVFKCISKFNSP